MTLNETMNEIADAIREKTGKSEKIAPIDFAEEIKSISAGGGDAPSGDDGWEYYDVRDSSEKATFLHICQFTPHFLAGILEYSGNEQIQYGVQELQFSNNNSNEKMKSNFFGFAYYAAHKVKVGETQMTMKEFIPAWLNQMGVTINIFDTAHQITKEEFYTL